MAKTMVSRLLESADSLLAERPGSSAFRRRAVSTAYYAVFHTLAKLCTEMMLPGAARDSVEYNRIYRALDHGPVKNVFSQPPLNHHARLSAIGRVVVVLQSERSIADYHPPDPKLFPPQQVRELVEQARQIIDRIETLSLDDRRLLATCLLFRTRST